jgi:glycosyltransferase involved in cell wall biosynthesis
MVAIYWNPEAYDASGARLLGRHSAGEGFIRGYIRHGTDERITLWNYVNGEPEAMEPLVRRMEPSTKPIDWVGSRDQAALRRAGVVNLPSPNLPRHAWARRLVGDQRAYSICGVTHTTVLSHIVTMFNDLAIAPVQPWDAIVCTSTSVIASLEVQKEMLDEYLQERLGAARIPRPQFVHIPLGISASDFETTPEQRKRWREELSIDDDDIVVLYVGRFNLTSKMNPVPMAMALERAAGRTGKRVHWVLAGWAEAGAEKQFRETVLAHCLKVNVHFVDGRQKETRFSIWSVGDIFISLSDNVQETFGLTPVEAMAAGLPSVISDWDGYKDTVRHGVDGFRVSTYMPAPGLGRDLALYYHQEWTPYDTYVSAVSQFTAIDVDETARALVELIDNPDLRARMGAAAREHARANFDWKTIIARYEEVWRDLDERRGAAPPEPPRTRNQSDNPWAPDPFRFFANYPSEQLTATSMLAPAGVSWADAQAVMKLPMVRLWPRLLPEPKEVQRILRLLVEKRQCTVSELMAAFPSGQRPYLERGLVWMAKYGLLTVIPRSTGEIALGD